MIGVFLAFAWLIAAATLYVGPPPLPLSRPAHRAVLDLLPDDDALPPGPVVELGVGWGGLVLSLARRYPSREIIGYELSPLPFAVAWLRVKRRGITHVRLQWRDFRREKFPAASLLTAYLGAESMRGLAMHLGNDLRPRARFISVAFALPGWIPSDYRRCRDLYGTPVYLYRCDPTHSQSAQMGPRANPDAPVGNS